MYALQVKGVFFRSSSKVALSEIWSSCKEGKSRSKRGAGDAAGNKQKEKITLEGMQDRPTETGFFSCPTVMFNYVCRLSYKTGA